MGGEEERNWNIGMMDIGKKFLFYNPLFHYSIIPFLSGSSI
jgi:hypothetical protein